MAAARWTGAAALLALVLSAAGQAEPVVVASYGQGRLWLKPYDWTYLRVELPASFSSVTMDFATDMDIQREQLKGLPRSELAIICLMNSNPPIPDISDSYLDTLLSNFLTAGPFGNIINQSNQAHCVPFQKNTTVVLTNDQISAGVWYIGYFHGLGPARTQSKMRDLHDYSGDISHDPLVVKSPNIGRWYIAVEIVNTTQMNTTSSAPMLDTGCFSLEWQLTGCSNGKAGINCSWEAYGLQRVPKRSPSVPFESYYVPADGRTSLEDSHFLLEQFLSNSSNEQFAWTYFFLDVPKGSAGALIHVQLKSDKELNYEFYSKYGGLPSNESWDYYASRTSSNNGSIFFSLQNSTNSDMDLSILYAKEGTWCLGVKHPSYIANSQTYISVSLQGCRSNCNQKGACHSSVDESGLTFYSFCTCDRDHGGFDCSDELVSPNGHIWQSVFLIASNAAAIFPAFWALRQKAFAEWILYTSSGISSALYHSCDVGTWCILSFRVLQFLDFWLSFMAVVGTFIYMATIDEASKRAMHTAVFILTALLAATGATRSTNIGIVIAIGSLGLLMGWLLEFSTARRFICWSWRANLNVPQRWPDFRALFQKTLEILNKRFRWLYLVLGFIALSFAATSWKLESNSSYWIWHSLWHITIYTSSFFFLCSMRVNTMNHSPEPNYELTRQDSLPRSESRDLAREER
ncbi:hypothetical protein EJB05_22148, partial [Eragrostis curvula]